MLQLVKCHCKNVSFYSFSLFQWWTQTETFSFTSIRIFPQDLLKRPEEMSPLLCSALHDVIWRLHMSLTLIYSVQEMTKNTILMNRFWLHEYLQTGHVPKIRKQPIKVEFIFNWYAMSIVCVDHWGIRNANLSSNPDEIPFRVTEPVIDSLYMLVFKQLFSLRRVLL